MSDPSLSRTASYCYLPFCLVGSRLSEFSCSLFLGSQSHLVSNSSLPLEEEPDSSSLENDNEFVLLRSHHCHTKSTHWLRLMRILVLWLGSPVCVIRAALWLWLSLQGKSLLELLALFLHNCVTFWFLCCSVCVSWHYPVSLFGMWSVLSYPDFSLIESHGIRSL